MAKKSKTLNLNESELRRLLLDQRAADRKRRVAAYSHPREAGRVEFNMEYLRVAPLLLFTECAKPVPPAPKPSLH